MKSWRKQSLADRLHRLNQGCCPIHGLLMYSADPSQREYAGLNPEEEDYVNYHVVACPRADCWICAKAFSLNGPWELMPRYLYLLREGADGEEPDLERDDEQEEPANVYTGSNRDTRPLRCEFPSQTVQALQTLAEETGEPTLTGVVRNALKVYAWIIEEQKQGRRILSEDQTTQHVRALDFLLKPSPAT